MKYNLLPFLVLLFLTLFTYSQNEAPVSSDSGAYVIVNYSPYSCCVDLGSFLRVYDVTCNTVIE